jgi:DNA-binding MarR family transcriptional regulator
LPESLDVSAADSAAPRSGFYTGSAYCAEESVGYLMKRIVLSVVHQADKRLGVHGLTSAQWAPLLRIQKEGVATVAELARWTLMDAGAMTRMLDRLEKKGLCRRVRSTEDRRVVQVELTPEGQLAIANVPAVLADVMNSMLAGFSTEEWQNLKSYLQRMVVNGEALREPH